ncbi:MAG TPA: UbiA family prenyltransferase [Desulfomonilaceae bacterium]|nr:UbiA family prenyltransferase [Desulfomonilaceae bacterium]
METSPEPAAQSLSSSTQSRWSLFLGLSRTPHGILDVATPAMAALLWLGDFPSLPVIVVGIVTAFAGYTAVYALNDLVDYKVDRERLSLHKDSVELFDVDGIATLHPLAQGFLSFRSGIAWTIFWALVALAGAWWLNPVCALIFLASASMETIYCKLLRITHLKIIPSVIVKASGGVAGVYAVDANPSVGFVVMVFLWLAAWEIGGQNIANDIMDMDDDARVAARTTSTVKGVPESVFRAIAAASMATFAGVAMYFLAGKGVGILYPIGAAVLGWWLLLQPARDLYYTPGPRAAAALFNRASYMPVSFLVLTAFSIMIAI